MKTRFMKSWLSCVSALCVIAAENAECLESLTLDWNNGKIQRKIGAGSLQEITLNGENTFTINENGGIFEGQVKGKNLYITKSQDVGALNLNFDGFNVYVADPNSNIYVKDLNVKCKNLVETGGLIVDHYNCKVDNFWSFFGFWALGKDVKSKESSSAMPMEKKSPADVGRYIDRFEGTGNIFLYGTTNVDLMNITNMKFFNFGQLNAAKVNQTGTADKRVISLEEGSNTNIKNSEGVETVVIAENAEVAGEVPAQKTVPTTPQNEWAAKIINGLVTDEKEICSLVRNAAVSMTPRTGRELLWRYWHRKSWTLSRPTVWYDGQNVLEWIAQNKPGIIRNFVNNATVRKFAKDESNKGKNKAVKFLAELDRIEAEIRQDKENVNALFAAVQDGDIDFLRSLKNIEKYVAAQNDTWKRANEDGGTLLLNAIRYCHFKGKDDEVYKQIVEYLLEKGANINTQDYKGRTPLHYAIMYDSRKIAQFLIDKGADINVQDNDGNTPLHLVVRPREARLFFANGSELFELVNFLIDRGAWLNIGNKDGETPLYCGLLHYIQLQKELEDYSEDVEAWVNGKLRKVKKYGDGAPDLIAGANDRLNACKKILDKMLAKGADPTIADSKSYSVDYPANHYAPNSELNTSMHLAVLTQNPDICKKIFTKRLAQQIVNSNYFRFKPSDYRNENGNYDVFKIGNDITYQNRVGNNPLLLAVQQGNAEIVRIVAECLSEVRALNSELGNFYMNLSDHRNGSSQNDTALRLAIRRADKESVKALLDNRANIKDPALLPIALDAMEGAISQGRRDWRQNDRSEREIVDILSKIGLFKNALGIKNSKEKTDVRSPLYKDDKGNRKPLYCALQKASDATIEKITRVSNIIEMLIARGVDVNALYEGLTPLHRLAISDPVDMIQPLIDLGANVDARDTEYYDYDEHESKGRTALHLVIQGHSGELENTKEYKLDDDTLARIKQKMAILLKNGADINAKDNQGRTPGNYSEVTNDELDKYLSSKTPIV